MTRLLLFLFGIILFISCSSTPNEELSEELRNLENLTVYPADEVPEFMLNLQETARITDTDDVILGRINGVRVDDSGRIFISDDSEKRINVYNSEGEFVTSMGRSGKGPGEFEYISNLSLNESHAFAMDFGIRRINVFSLETLGFDFSIPMLKEGHQISELERYYPSSFYLLESGEILVLYSQPFGRMDDESEQRYNRIYKVDQQGNIQPDQVLEVEPNEPLVYRTDNSVTVFGIPFGAKQNFSITADQKIAVNRSDQFLFKMYDESGNYERAFYHPFSPKELTRERAMNQFDNENYRRAVRNYDLPESWPAINGFVTDDEGRFWVSTIVDDEDVYEWWILSSNGELLAKQIWPRSTSVQEVKNGYLYTREENDMGLIEIVKYRLSLS